MYRQLGQMGCAVERLCGFGKKMPGHSREIQMLSKRQEIFKNANEGKLTVQDRASERLQDQIIEEMKELEST